VPTIYDLLSRLSDTRRTARVRRLAKSASVLQVNIAEDGNQQLNVQKPPEDEPSDVCIPREMERHENTTQWRKENRLIL